MWCVQFYVCETEDIRYRDEYKLHKYGDRSGPQCSSLDSCELEEEYETLDGRLLDEEETIKFWSEIFKIKPVNLIVKKANISLASAGV